MLDFNKIKITLISSDTNNIFNLNKSLKDIGYKTKIFENEKKIDSDIVILPGVGSYSDGIKYLKKNQIDEKIKDFLDKKNKFLLGICLGMQLLLSESEEFGKTSGLNLIEGKVKKMKNFKEFKIPHIGWAKCKVIKKKNKCLQNKDFYFIHSFRVKTKNSDHVLAKTLYGSNYFDSVIKKKNILGVQFHPEKSSRNGEIFLKNILNI